MRLFVGTASAHTRTAGWFADGLKTLKLIEVIEPVIHHGSPILIVLKAIFGWTTREPGYSR
jgi:hypothetical protein